MKDTPKKRMDRDSSKLVLQRGHLLELLAAVMAAFLWITAATGINRRQLEDTTNNYIESYRYLMVLVGILDTENFTNPPGSGKEVLSVEFLLSMEQWYAPQMRKEIKEQGHDKIKKLIPTRVKATLGAMSPEEVGRLKKELYSNRLLRGKEFNKLIELCGLFGGDSPPQFLSPHLWVTWGLRCRRILHETNPLFQSSALQSVQEVLSDLDQINARVEKMKSDYYSIHAKLPIVGVEVDIKSLRAIGSLLVLLLLATSWAHLKLILKHGEWPRLTDWMPTWLDKPEDAGRAWWSTALLIMTATGEAVIWLSLQPYNRTTPIAIVALIILGVASANCARWWFRGLNVANIGLSGRRQY